MNCFYCSMQPVSHKRTCAYEDWIDPPYEYKIASTFEYLAVRLEAEQKKVHELEAMVKDLKETSTAWMVGWEQFREVIEVKTDQIRTMEKLKELDMERIEELKERIRVLESSM